jgi:hypothetical protein
MRSGITIPKSSEVIPEGQSGSITKFYICRMHTPSDQPARLDALVCLDHPLL